MKFVKIQNDDAIHTVRVFGTAGLMYLPGGRLYCFSVMTMILTPPSPQIPHVLITVTRANEHAKLLGLYFMTSAGYAPDKNGYDDDVVRGFVVTPVAGAVECHL